MVRIRIKEGVRGAGGRGDLKREIEDQKVRSDRSVSFCHKSTLLAPSTEEAIVLGLCPGEQ